MPITPAPRLERRSSPWRLGVSVTLAWLALVVGLEWRNPRLVPAWHGFLHSAVVDRSRSTWWVPENPFFAGEPLPYYWVYHKVAAALATFGVNALLALHSLVLLSLGVLVLISLAIGRRITGSAGAGVLIGFLALAGANPLGPGVAVAHLLRGDVSWRQPDMVAETVFVSDADADRMMSRPLLQHLYFGADWRIGQNVVWFWDLSSRAPALAALMGLTWALLRGIPWLLLPAALLVTLLNPLIGLGVAACLGGSVLVGARSARSRAHEFGLAAVIWLGALLAVPTFLHLFEYSGAARAPQGSWLLVKTTSLSLSYGPLALLAVAACRFAPVIHRAALWRLTAGGVGLLVTAAIASLAEGNEHNLANAAGVLLAVPAGVGPWFFPSRGTGFLKAPVGAWVIAMAFVPMMAATLIAFDDRPPLPFRYVRQLERVPSGQPLARMHDWIRRHTPSRAVLVVDPDRAIKMSGNVSELPAFSGRPVFVDQDSYLTRPYGGAFEQRRRIARLLVRGEPLSSADGFVLERLRRPVFLVSAHTERRDRLVRRYGQARFSAGAFAVFGPLGDAWRDTGGGSPGVGARREATESRLKEGLFRLKSSLAPNEDVLR